MKTKILMLLLGLTVSPFLNAQLVKDFDLSAPTHQSLIHLQGDPSQVVSFVWTSGKGNPSPGTNYFYDLSFADVNGDLAVPEDVISHTQYSAYFSDTVLNFSMELWDGFLNGISNQLTGHDFFPGDTLKLKWRANLTAIQVGPTYAFEQSDSDFDVLFVRGLFEDEYTPVNLYTPAHNAQVSIEGNPGQMLNFSWSSAWCQGTCDTPTFWLLIDTVPGDFSNPVISVKVPSHDSSWSLFYTTLNQILIDTKTPDGATRLVWWKVMTTGGPKTQYSPQTRTLVLSNGMLNNEHHPFALVNPGPNLIVTLSGPATTQLNFKWESTWTVQGPASKYFLVFDTADASPMFANPLFQYSPANVQDTAINLLYGDLDHKLDSLYPGWTSANLMWSVKALVNGNIYYPEAAHDVEFKAGTIIGLNALQKSELTLYPNPSGNQVVYLSGLAPGIRELTVFDALGRAVGTYEVSGEGSLNLSGLQPGTYLIRCQHGDNTYSGRFTLLP